MKKISLFLQLVDTLARFNLKVEASRFYLGYLWWVFEPLLYVAIFYYVFKYGIQIGTEDYLLFLICGKFMFLWFSKSVIASSMAIKNNTNIFIRVKISKTLFPYSAVHSAFYKEILSLLVIVILCTWLGSKPATIWVFLLPLLLTQYILTMACGLAAALLVSLIADFSNLITFVMLFLLISSGVFWDIRNIENPELVSLIFALNPIAFLIDSYRQILIEQQLYNLKHLLMLGICVILATISLHILTEKFSSRLTTWMLR